MATRLLHSPENSTPRGRGVYICIVTHNIYIYIYIYIYVVHSISFKTFVEAFRIVVDS